jgi:hypothetical protein
MERGKRDLENCNINWGLRLKKWHSKCHRMFWHWKQNYLCINRLPSRSVNRTLIQTPFWNNRQTRGRILIVFLVLDRSTFDSRSGVLYAKVRVWASLHLWGQAPRHECLYVCVCVCVYWCVRVCVTVGVDLNQETHAVDRFMDTRLYS